MLLYPFSTCGMLLFHKIKILLVFGVLMVLAFSSLLTFLTENLPNNSQAEDKMHVPDVPRKTSGLSVVLGKDGRYSCPHQKCSLTYKAPYYVIRHYKTAHLGVRFSCSKCGQQWVDKRNLQNHRCPGTVPLCHPVLACNPVYVSINVQY